MFKISLWRFERCSRLWLHGLVAFLNSGFFKFFWTIGQFFLWRVLFWSAINLMNTWDGGTWWGRVVFELFIKSDLCSFYPVNYLLILKVVLSVRNFGIRCHYDIYDNMFDVENQIYSWFSIGHWVFLIRFVTLIIYTRYINHKICQIDLRFYDLAIILPIWHSETWYFPDFCWIILAQILLS